jgi:hypothetical protein
MYIFREDVVGGDYNADGRDDKLRPWRWALLEGCKLNRHSRNSQHFIEPQSSLPITLHLSLYMY